MRGIPEEELNEALAMSAILPALNILLTLKHRCKELNTWKPIESAPKDRSVLLYSPEMESGCKQFVGRIESAWYWKPTHWQELPEDPK